MEAVVIGIGCDDDFIIAEAFKAVFDTAFGNSGSSEVIIGSEVYLFMRWQW